MTPYATYNEYYAACKTVEKMIANRKRTEHDTKELLEMIQRIKLTDKMNMQ
jgi:CTP-dependent riboflavin kinase